MGLIKNYLLGVYNAFRDGLLILGSIVLGCMIENTWQVAEGMWTWLIFSKMQLYTVYLSLWPL